LSKNYKLWMTLSGQMYFLDYKPWIRQNFRDHFRAIRSQIIGKIIQLILCCTVFEKFCIVQGSFLIWYLKNYFWNLFQQLENLNLMSCKNFRFDPHWPKNIKIRHALFIFCFFPQGIFKIIWPCFQCGRDVVIVLPAIWFT